MMKLPESKHLQLEIPNSSVLDAADQYYDGAIHLKSLPPGSGVLLPLLTNGILALELYVKSLNVWSVIPEYEDYGDGIFGGEVKCEPRKGGHKLSVLLDSYYDNLKNEINRLHETGEIPLDHAGLVTRLQRYDRFFEEIRYSYENDCLKAFDLDDFWDAIELMKKIVRTIKPIFKDFSPDQPVRRSQKKRDQNDLSLPIVSE